MQCFAINEPRRIRTGFMRLFCEARRWMHWNCALRELCAAGLGDRMNLGPVAGVSGSYPRRTGERMRANRLRVMRWHRASGPRSPG